MTRKKTTMHHRRHGSSPSPPTLVFQFRVYDAAAYGEFLASSLDALIEIGAPAESDVDYGKFAQNVCERVIEMHREKTEDGIGMLLARGIWYAFNSPVNGLEVREGVAQFLRSHGRACITWHVGASGRLILSVGDRPDDIEDDGASVIH